MDNWSFPLLNKTELRKMLRAKRCAISSEQRHAGAADAVTLLKAHPLFQSSQRIACYFAATDEFDCAPIIELIWREQKQCYLPTLASEKENFLEFALYQRNDPLRSNRYQILEPDNTERVSATALDLVLMPLLGFDLEGHRLGMGGGYYDRTFAFLLENKYKKPHMIGLAFSDQEVDQLPHDPWDIPLEGMLTENQFISFLKTDKA